MTLYWIKLEFKQFQNPTIIVQHDEIHPEAISQHGEIHQSFVLLERNIMLQFSLGYFSVKLIEYTLH